MIFSLENVCIFRQMEDFLSNFGVEVSDKIFQQESIPVGCVMYTFLVPVGSVSKGCVSPEGVSRGACPVGVCPWVCFTLGCVHPKIQT